MKILTVCSGMGIGGTERAAQNFTLEYQRAGHEVAVLNWGGRGPRQKIIEMRGIPVFTAGSNLNGAISDADSFDPDVIHIHRRGWRDDRETQILQRLRKKDRRILEQNVFGGVDRSPGADLIDVHLQLSSWCMWRWRRLLGSKSVLTAGAVIPYPVDPADFGEVTETEVREFRMNHRIGSDCYLCGRVGQPIEGKWHPQTVTAFASLARKEPKAYLMLIGASPKIVALISSLPSEIRQKIVHMPVTSSDRELRVFYSSLDCFIHAANQGESFGFVLTEAMMCNCPVVTVSQPYKDNSQIEVVGHGKGGLVAASLEHFPKTVQILWADAELRRQIRGQARQHVLSRFEVSKVVADTLRIAEISRESSSRTETVRRLEASEMKTRVDDAEIYSLCNNAVGRPSQKDFLLMYLMHKPIVDRGKAFLRAILKRN